MVTANPSFLARFDIIALMNKRERVAIDLDGTLTVAATNQLRSGATELLEELIKNRELILWTSGNHARLEEFLEGHPELAGVFAQTVCSGDFLDADDCPILPPDFQVADPNLLDRVTNILRGYEGGKIPPLVGAEVVIDDTAPWMQGAAQLFGFRAIDAGSKRNDPTSDAWVVRVLAELDK